VAHPICPLGARHCDAADGGGGGEVGPTGRFSFAPFDPDLGLGFPSVFFGLIRFEFPFSFSLLSDLQPRLVTCTIDRLRGSTRCTSSRVYL
jgi:hypothetical protein